MEGRPIRKVWLTSELRDELRDYTKRNEITMASVIIEILERIVADPFDEDVNGINEGVGDVSVSVEVQDGLWFDARVAAMKSRSTLAGRVRKYLTLTFREV